jgi:uncharacterized protein YjaG (DUF416 family)
MNWTEYREHLKQNLSRLTDTQKIQFAIGLCEKLLPDYQNFVNETNWGDIKTITKGLNFAKQYTKGLEMTTDDLNSLITEIEKNIPDTEDFGQVSDSLALNAACAVLEVLNFALDKKNERIFDIGNFSYDAVYFKVYESNPELSEADIEKHISLQNEIKSQLEKTKHIA